MNKSNNFSIESFSFSKQESDVFVYIRECVWQRKTKGEEQRVVEEKNINEAEERERVGEIFRGSFIWLMF